MPARLVHRLLEDAAAARADHPAVLDGAAALAYGELDERAARVARLLHELGVRRGDLVGLHLDKSPAALVGLYGILKAGAAYVPLDPAAPPLRLGAIARDARLRWLVSAAAQAPGWPALLAAGAPLEWVVSLDDPGEDARAAVGVAVVGPSALAAQPAAPPPVALTGDDLAYVLYTSGSTGAPKGVMLTHGNALGFVAWAGDTFAVGPGDRLSSHAPLHFDLSVFDLFAAARAGATVVPVPRRASVFPRELARFLAERAITVWYSVPSVLGLLALRGGLRPGDLPALRAVLFAGEVFPTEHLRRLMRLLPRARFANLYGPTETNVCTWHEVGPLDDGQHAPIPIGTPIDGVRTLVVGDDDAPVAAGEVGELCVLGPTVMRGYRGDPARTARVLRPVRGHEAAGPAYRTGDLARVDDAGRLHLLGRRDHQVKSRGYRIELGDVEAALHAHPQVVECAVVAVPDDVVTNRLRARVVVAGALSAGELRAHCRRRLPEYMVPERFELADALPRTSTGKLDRRGLAAALASSTDAGGAR